MMLSVAASFLIPVPPFSAQPLLHKHGPRTANKLIAFHPRRGETIVRLIQRGLPDEAFESHREGWGHYIGRLVSRAAGEDPGPDPAVLT